MKIPLPGLMRHWREEEFRLGASSLAARLGLKVWATFARRPRLYHAAARLGMPLLSLFARRGALKLPLAGSWTRHRDLPAPQGRTFQALWADTRAGVPR